MAWRLALKIINVHIGSFVYKNLSKLCFYSTDVVLNNVGPVIGAHSGPGTVALFFLGRHR